MDLRNRMIRSNSNILIVDLKFISIFVLLSTCFVIHTTWAECMPNSASFKSRFKRGFNQSISIRQNDTATHHNQDYLSPSQPRHLSPNLTQRSNDNLHPQPADFLFVGQTSSSSSNSNLYQSKITDQLDLNISMWLDEQDTERRTLRDDIRRKPKRGETLEGAKRAWTILHEHTRAALSNKINLILRPEVDQLFAITPNISKQCKKAVFRTLDAAVDMDAWAVKVLASWGNFPPVGLFDSVFTEIGSYKTCISVNNNSIIGHAHYCSITLRPVLPDKSIYRTVFTKEDNDLLELFHRPLNSERDIFTDLLDDAQYFRSLYIKTGTCWPIDCTPFDIKKLVKTIGRRIMLVHGPIRCMSETYGDYQPNSSTNAGLQIHHNRTTSINDNMPNIDSSGSYKDTSPLTDRYSHLGIYTYMPQILTVQYVALILIGIISLSLLTTGILDIFFCRLPRFWVFYWSLLSQRSVFDVLPQVGNTIQERNEMINNHENNQTTSNLIEKSTSLNNISSFAENEEHYNNNMRVEYNKVNVVSDMKTSTRMSINIPNQPIMASLSSGFRTITLMDNHKSNQENGNESSKSLGSFHDCSFIDNWNLFFFTSSRKAGKDITCVDGIRVLTLSWIIINHVMLGCDWAAMGRNRELENPMKSFFYQPMLNALLLVDTFFLISGLLSAYTLFNWTRGKADQYKWFLYLVGRWLRLTPQIFLMSLFYIVLPMLNRGPNWYPPVYEYSENCMENWWVNLLQLHAYFRRDRICNLVTWWTSVDFTFSIISSGVVWLLIRNHGGHKIGFVTISFIITSQLIVQAYNHYINEYPPQIFASFPQDAVVWGEMGRDFYWKPHSHTFSYFMGFYLGYLLSMKSKLLVRLLTPRCVAIGWTVSCIVWIFLGYDAYWWSSGLIGYNQAIATSFAVMTPMIWTLAHVWMIIACHFGHGGFINGFLSISFFKTLSKATYMTYLAHPQIILFFYGSQQLLLEPNGLIMFCFGFGLLIASYLYGIFLTIFFEYPYLRILNRIINYIIN